MHITFNEKHHQHHHSLSALQPLASAGQNQSLEILFNGLEMEQPGELRVPARSNTSPSTSNSLWDSLSYCSSNICPTPDNIKPSLENRQRQNCMNVTFCVTVRPPMSPARRQSTLSSNTHHQYYLQHTETHNPTKWTQLSSKLFTLG